MNTLVSTSTEFLSAAELAELRLFSSPTIANAIETFGVRPRLVGITRTGVNCHFPQLGPMVGYACTATILSSQPPAKPRKVDRREYWEYVRDFPAQKVSVVQDLSETPMGAYWGEVNVNMHQALGSQGLLTNGAVRDLVEVERARFHVFAGSVAVSHGWAHLEDFNRPVEVFGMLVQPGDLIHADLHGAVVIPHEIAGRVAQAARQVEASEKPILAACGTPEMIDVFDQLVSPDY